MEASGPREIAKKPIRPKLTIPLKKKKKKVTWSAYKQDTITQV